MIYFNVIEPDIKKCSFEEHNKIDANSYHTKSQTMYGSYLYRELYRLNSSSPESVENPDTFSDRPEVRVRQGSPGIRRRGKVPHQDLFRRVWLQLCRLLQGSLISGCRFRG